MSSPKMLVLALAFCGGSIAMRVRKEASMMEEMLEESKASVNATDENVDEAARGEMPVLDNDINPIGEGTIHGSHGLLVLVFGGSDGLAVDDLRRISLERRFPRGYRFGGRLLPITDHFVGVPGATHRGRQGTLMSQAVNSGSTRCRGGGDNNRICNTPFVSADIRNVNFIICPFLSTLVNEGALPVKQTYTRDELQAATELAGLDHEIAELHSEGNFINDPDMIQDLWNLEGVSNEHVTSTGIHDCQTSFKRCTTGREVPDQDCETQTERDCVYGGNSGLFDQFVREVDQNRNGFITLTELDEAAARAEAAGEEICHGGPGHCTYPAFRDVFLKRCWENCQARGHCCSDTSIGSNQFVSCFQACQARADGVDRRTCSASCEQTRSCTMTVGSKTFNACDRCADLKRSCPFGVPDRQACRDGCEYE